MRREVKSLRNGVHHANGVVWGPVYRTHPGPIIIPSGPGPIPPGPYAPGYIPYGRGCPYIIPPPPCIIGTPPGP